MTVQLALRIPNEELAALDAAIAGGRWPNRTAALREALRRLLLEERDRQIEEAYRRGYGTAPQEDWMGETGLTLMREAVRVEEAGDLGAEPL